MQIYLQSYGAKLRVKDRLFEVIVFDENQRVKKEQFSPKEVDGIWLSTHTSLSADAIMLAAQNNVSILVMNHFGMPVGRFLSTQPSSTTKIQKRQLEASIGKEGVKHIKNWTSQKLERQSEFISLQLKSRSNPDPELCRDCIEHLTGLKEKVLALEAESIDEIADTIRGLEGTAGRFYFTTLGQIVPPGFRFEGRSRRPAKDIFNAMLNYGYGILYARVEEALFSAGINPYVGFLHRDGHRFKAMVFDFIEPYRVWIDQVVFRLASQKKIGKKHTIKKDGGLWISDHGKRVLVHAINEFMKFKKMKYNNKTHHPEFVLLAEARAFASSLKQD